MQFFDHIFTEMYINKRIQFIFISNAVIMQDHIHTNLNLRFIHLAEADSETWLD